MASPQEPGEQSADDFGGLDFDSGPKPEPGKAAPKRRPQPGPGSAVKQFVGIFGGGALGLVVGYIILVLIGGPKANFLHLNIPGLTSSESKPAPPAPSKSEADAALAAAAAARKAAEEQGDEPDEPMPPPPEPTPEPTEPEPPVETVTSANYVGPRTYKAFSGADLRQVVDTFAPDTNMAVDAPLYRRLSHLAEVFTSVEMVPMGWSARERRDVVENLLVRVVTGDAAANQLGILAAAWLNSPHRDGPGVVAAGMLEGVQTEGRITRTRLMLFGKPQELIVLSRTRPAWQPPTPVLVVGTIVDDPVQGVAGYTGPPGRVVWATLFVKR